MLVPLTAAVSVATSQPSFSRLSSSLSSAWRIRADRGAEKRLAQKERAPLAPAEELRADPHLEMHTRGG